MKRILMNEDRVLVIVTFQWVLVNNINLSKTYGIGEHI